MCRLIIIFTVISLVTFVVLYFLWINRFESYDNLIPNKIRWSIYESKTKEDFDKIWLSCRNNCKNKGLSELGCLQSCREHIKDQLYTLRNRNRNYFT